MLEVGVPSGGCVIRNMDLFRLLVTLLVWLSWTEGEAPSALQLEAVRTRASYLALQASKTRPPRLPSASSSPTAPDVSRARGASGALNR